MYKISDEVINFIEKTMKTWRVELTAVDKRIAKAEVRSGICQVANVGYVVIETKGSIT